MKKNLLIATVIVLNCVLLSCSSSSDVTEDLGDTKQAINMLSDPEYIQLTPAQQDFANDNNQFTLNFLKTVNEVDQSGKSFIYSPLSITYVLGMVNDAAVGETEKELEQTLGFHEGGIQAVNEYCKKLIEGLPKVDKDVTLNIANAIFVNQGYTLKKQFEQDMKYYYDAKAEALDFSSPETLDHINGWCNDKTRGMIPTILDEVDPGMMSYLLNAIYFKADWGSKFDPKNTKLEEFQSVNHEKNLRELPMMHQKVLISYVENEEFSAIKIPYGNGMWNMTVFLPKEEKSTNDVINYLSTVGFRNIESFCGTGGGVFSSYEVDLKLPRFETASDTDDLNGKLIGLMQKMGIHLAFDHNFSEIPNMCEVPVHIEMMRQKAKIKVNEEGSEAAAVTVGGIYENSGPSIDDYPKATFHANRPFVYVIREASSGVILFVGKFTGI